MNPLALLAAIRAHAAGGGQPGPGGPAGPPQGGLAGPGGPLGQGPQGPPPGSDQSQGGGGGDFSSIVKRMITLGVQGQQAAPDAVDASGMAKIVAQLHQMLATEQQDRDAALGTSPAIRSMRRSSAAQQG